MTVNDWNAALYDQKHAFVSGYGQNLVSLLEPRKDEFILDLGCGTGQLASIIAQAGAHVIGIDSSPTMIDKARTAYPTLDFRVMDARHIPFSNQFDAVFSNAALHWIPEAEEVIRNVAAALKPGGRFVVEMGGKGNVATIVTTAQQAIEEIMHTSIESGWYFPSIGEYTPLLEQHGLMVQSAWLFARPTPLQDGERGLHNWLEMFSGRLLQTVPGELKSQVIARIEELARPRLYQAGQWTGDYVRLRIVAHKEKA